MIVKKQYIPKRYRSKKLVNSGGGVAVGGSFTLGDQVDTSAFLLADKFTSLFEYDEVNDAIKAKLPFYSEGEISAYGYGGSGGGGGTGIVYNGLDSTITDIALSAYMGNVLNTTKLNVSTFNSWVSNYVPPVPSWGDITGKPSTFPASAHVHGWGEIESKPTTFTPSAHTHTWDSIESKPSVITGTTASFTTALEAKLNGIAAGANNYTHPATHAPSIIAQDANNRFVTDANIATWNAKEPPITKGTTAQYFRGDMSLALFPTSLPASDVSDWAKESVKPTYVWSEIGNKPTTFAPSAHTHNISEIGITGLSTNYLTKFNGSTLVNSSIFDNGTNVGIGGEFATPNSKLQITGGWLDVDRNYGFRFSVEDQVRASIRSNASNEIRFSTGSIADAIVLADSGLVGFGTTDPTATLDVNGIGKFKDDIITNFKTWTKDSSKSLKSFLDKFDIDANGNLVVLGNLYSTGEVTAYSSGTGVSGLKLMGDMDANGKNINNLTSISKSGSKIRLLEGVIAFDVEGYNNQLMVSSDGIYSNTYIAASSFHTSGMVESSEFKFGNWTFKQDVSGRLGIYNGTTEVACFNTDGTYVNL